MKKLNVYTDVNVENACFHFVNKDKLTHILKAGYYMQKVDNVFGENDKRRIYFSKGVEAILQTWDIWIKWLAYDAMADLLGNTQIARIEARERLENNTIFSFGSPLNELDFFTFIKEYMLKKVYLVLDFVEDVDYHEDDRDNVKQKLISQKKLDLIKNFYGEYTELTGEMDIWNYHTVENLKIEPDRISMLVTNSGENVYSIVKSLCQKMDISKYTMLEKFINFNI